jgi:hypothetical protein
MSEPDDWEETDAELPVRGDEPAPVAAGDGGPAVSEVAIVR